MSFSGKRVSNSDSRDCPFCVESDHLIKNSFAFVRRDRFAVSPGHLLIVPFRHVSSFFDLTTEERLAVWELLPAAKALVEETHTPDGYNIGVNVGEAGGQSVWHVHVHLIPRYLGDVPNPRGGVRGVIPMKQNY